MAWISRFVGRNQDPQWREHQAEQETRSRAWDAALNNRELPEFVVSRLRATQAGKRPWISTASVGALVTQRTHGIEPVGMVSGNCWYHFGYSWTQGHYDGWHTAIGRMQEEAAILQANAVVDVQMRVTRMPGAGADQMDYAVYGTAVRIAGLRAPSVPVVATVSALEFARLMEAGILPVGLAIGANYEWYYPNAWGSYGAGNMIGSGGWMNQGFGGNVTGAGTWWNQELTALSEFMTNLRENAISQLATDAARIGTGVLARVQFSELIRVEGQGENAPPRFLGRHIAFGTAILHEPRRHRPLGVRSVVSVSDQPMKSAGTLDEEEII